MTPSDVYWTLTRVSARSVCPGKYFSEDSSWLMIAQFLATFSITAVEGQPFPQAEFMPGGVS